MTRIETIIEKVRYNLSDIDGHRWDDTRLLYLVDEAQKQLVHKTGDLKQIFNLDIVAGQKVYSLPDNIIMLNRIEYKQNKLTLISYEKFFTIKTPKYQTPEFAIYDKLNRGQFIIHPIEKLDENIPNGITVFATIMPDTITSTNNELQISAIYDDAIIYYVTYSALLDNQDTSSLQVAGEFKNKYTVELQYLFKEASIDYTQKAPLNPYKGFV